MFLDWSERHHHLAGALGNGLLKKFLTLGWITQDPSIRAVTITDKGKIGFKKNISNRNQVKLPSKVHKEWFKSLWRQSYIYSFNLSILDFYTSILLF